MFLFLYPATLLSSGRSGALLCRCYGVDPESDPLCAACRRSPNICIPRVSIISPLEMERVCVRQSASAVRIFACFEELPRYFRCAFSRLGCQYFFARKLPGQVQAAAQQKRSVSLVSGEVGPGLPLLESQSTQPRKLQSLLPPSPAERIREKQKSNLEFFPTSERRWRSSPTTTARSWKTTSSPGKSFSPLIRRIRSRPT